MAISTTNFSFSWSFFSSSFRDAFIDFNDKFLFLGLSKNTRMGRKNNKKCIIMYLLLQINITKSYKLNTTIVYTKMTNNDGIRQF